MIAEKLSVLNKDNYNSVYDMITSKDKGSTTVGFSVLENVNYEESEIFLLCMLKQLNNNSVTMHTIKTEATLLYNKLENYCNSKGVTDLKISFKYIYERAIERSVDKDNKNEIKFLLDLFKNELIELLTQYGFTFLEYLDIEIKQKEI